MTQANSYFIETLEQIMLHGWPDSDPRAKWEDGTPAFSKCIGPIFEQYDLSDGIFPIPTYRHIAWESAIQEMLWIYQDKSNTLEDAHERGIKWWDKFDIGNGTIGNRYGYTVNKHHLICDLLEGLKKTPFSKRHIMSLWQVDDLKSSEGLYPCAYETLFTVRPQYNKLYLDMTLVQRSSDWIIAKAINSIQYVALQMSIAATCGYEVGVFTHFVQNAHVYDRHIEIAEGLIKSTPVHTQPIITMNPEADMYSAFVEDFNIALPELPKYKIELAI